VGLVVRCPEALPQVLLNRRRLVYVLSNLVRNAVQHSPAGAVVEVAVEPEGKAPGAGLVCRVRDRGSGIAAEDLPRLFEPFFSRRRGGTGLGLAVAQRIVEEHGGRIRARNRPGGGAEVTFWLPSLAPDRGTGEAALCGARSGGGA
jgi:signal transduction histidine kinase